MTDEKTGSIIPDTDTGRAVIVRWIDSGTAIPGWSDARDLPDNVETVESIGFWIGENENVIAIAGTQTDDQSFLNCQLIWKKSIEEKMWA
jgi:hypothetical protein